MAPRGNFAARRTGEAEPVSTEVEKNPTYDSHVQDGTGFDAGVRGSSAVSSSVAEGEGRDIYPSSVQHDWMTALRTLTRDDYLVRTLLASANCVPVYQARNIGWTEDSASASEEVPEGERMSCLDRLHVDEGDQGVVARSGILVPDVDMRIDTDGQHWESCDEELAL